MYLLRINRNIKSLAGADFLISHKEFESTINVDTRRIAFKALMNAPIH